jgi:cell wall-associated NlpC family hydrolase
MDGEMVLRRLPVLAVLCLLALVAGTPVARADHRHDGGGYVDDGTYDTDGGGYYDDGSYGTEGGGYVDDGTDPADVAPPATTPAPATTTDPAETTSPYTDEDTLDPRPTPVPVPVLPTIPVTKTVPGTVAKLRTDGKAAIPRGAPKRVQALIAAANKIVGKPYKWGGGHAKLADVGYDCSGAVSYALIGAGVLASPMVSGTLAKWQATGSGKWLSIYANKGHVYLEVAGLRLDTSPVGDPTRRNGVRWRPVIGRRAGFHARHVLGL